MALHCEFIDVIIPIENIDRVYPGGFVAYKAEHAEEFKRRMYHDEFLFHDGAMSSHDIQQIVEEWESRGLVSRKVVGGREYWNELCIVSMSQGTTLSCEWAVYNQKLSCIHLKGQPSTPVISNYK